MDRDPGSARLRWCHSAVSSTNRCMRFSQTLLPKLRPIEELTGFGQSVNGLIRWLKLQACRGLLMVWRGGGGGGGGALGLEV